MDEKKLLPEKYYLTNYLHLLSVIESKYSLLLSNSEKLFIEYFKSLPEDEKCLFLRLQNRKGRYFRFSKFNYPEIQSLDNTLQTLIKKGFCAIVGSETDSALELLDLYNRKELLEMLSYFDITIKGLSKYNKLELVGLLQKILPEKELWEVFKEEPIIKQGFTDEALMLQFLYFGTLDLDMSQFVIRDLGNLRFETIDENRLSANFENRKDAEDKLMLSLAYRYFRELRHGTTSDDYFELIHSWLLNTTPLGFSAKPLYDRLVLKSARFLEQNKLPEEALTIYNFTQKAPSRERRARIYHKTGSNEEAIKLCNDILESPENAEEKYFAKDFLLKITGSERYVKSTSKFQKKAEVISIDKSWQYQVEMGVLDYYATHKKMEGFFAENYIWRAVWGLFFWDIIFDDEHTGLHHPFQRSPDDLFTENFLLLRNEAIKNRLRLLDDQTACYDFLANMYKVKYGIANPVIGWFEELWDILEVFISKVPLQNLKKVLLTMCQNLKDNSRGFPDLFVWNEDDYLFIEVKSPNDTLSAQQLFWLEMFNEEGINACLVNVKWT